MIKVFSTYFATQSCFIYAEEFLFAEKIMNARSKIGATEYKENVYALGPRRG